MVPKELALKGVALSDPAGNDVQTPAGARPFSHSSLHLLACLPKPVPQIAFIFASTVWDVPIDRFSNVNYTISNVIGITDTSGARFRRVLILIFPWLNCDG